jgi:2-methylcitrate dehydratase
MEPPKIARHYAMESTADPGARILGTKHYTTLELAAFANGVMGRYLDFNDTSHTRDSGHPSDMIPAMLSTAEYCGCNGRSAITGIIVAYEIMDRLGEVCGLTQIGFDYTTYVAIGSAAGAGSILGISESQMANAIALAASSFIGLLQIRVGHLSMWKGCASGNASRNGVFAAMIAARGMTGPIEAFRGPSGFLCLLTRGDVELQAFGGPEKPFMVEMSKFKNYPSDYECQCAVNPAIELHQFLKDRIGEIEKIVVYGYKFAINVATDSRDKWDPRTRETADHSLPYLVAVALIKGDVWLDDFEEKNYRNPERLALMKKIEVREDEEFTRDYPESYRFSIEVMLRSGEKFVRDVRYAKGHPKNPLTDDEIETKFRKLSREVMSHQQIDTVLKELWHIEEVDDISDIITSLEL